jgi:hypothetical protein
MGVVEAIRIAASSHPQIFAGDIALIDLGARDAWQGHQVLGPYSRFGWHHPGPALFYLMALPVRLMGDGPGVNLTAVLINAAAAVGAVALVWRRAGVTAALWTSAALTAFAVVLTPDFVRNPWTPYVVVIPLVVLALLLADGATGHPVMLVWALALGSAIIQTDISTLPVVGLLFVVAGASVAVRWWRGRQATPDGRIGRSGSRPHLGWLLGGGLGLTVLVWVPPVISAVRDRHNNFLSLGKFFIHHHPTHSLHEATHAGFVALTVLPFGLWNEAHRTHIQIVLGALGIAGVGLVALGVGAKRRQWFGVGLVVAALLSIVGGIVALTRVVGPIEDYLALWMSFAPVVLLIGLGVSLFGPSSTIIPAGSAASRDGAWVQGGLPSVVVGAAVALLAVGFGTASVVNDVHTPAVWTRNDPVMTDLNKDLRPALAPSDRLVGIRILTHAAWPEASGLVLDLERHGRRATVGGPDDWTFMFGDRRRPNGREDVDVLLYLNDDKQAAVDARSARVVGTSGGVVMAVRPGGP